MHFRNCTILKELALVQFEWLQFISRGVRYDGSGGNGFQTSLIIRPHIEKLFWISDDPENAHDKVRVMVYLP